MRNSRIYIVLITFSIILSIYLSYVILTNVNIGIDVELNENGQLEVVDLHNWARETGIKDGDIIISINNEPSTDHWTVIKYRTVEQADSILVKKPNDLYAQLAPSKQLRTRDLFFQFIIPASFMALMIVFSILLYRKKKEEKSALILTFFFLMFGLSLLSSHASARADIIGKIIVVSGFLYTPTLLMHFFNTYFKKKDVVFCNSKVFLPLYSWVTLVFLAQSVFLIVDLGYLYNYLRITELVTFVFSFLICLFYFVRGFVTYRHSDVRPVFQLIMFGLIFSFGPIVLLHTIPLVINYQPVINGDIGSLFIYLMPLTLFYLVSTERFFDIDFIIDRLAYYMLISLIPTPIVLAIFSLFKSNLSFSQIIELFVLVHVTLIIVLYMKEDFGYIFRQKLFYEKHNLQASLHQFAHHLSKSMKKDDIETHINNEIKSVLKVTNAKIIEYDKQTNTLLTEENEQIFKEITKQKMPTGELKSVGDMYLVFVGGSSEKEYFLYFSGKKNNTKLNLNEREWLKTISYLINLAFENLQLVEGLVHKIEDLRDKNIAPSWVLRLLFNLQEQERKKFATDIHDSALQTQLIWYRKLETYLDEHALTAIQKLELDQIKEGFMDVIYEIRQTCNEMLPPFLKDFGLKKALKDLVDISQTRYFFLIDLDTDNLEENLNDETVLILYRVIQELLNNAVKHSHANHIKIRLETLGDVTILSYKDDGSSFDVNDIKKDCFGLSGISERVRSVEGEMVLKTAVDQGVEITIKIPAWGYFTGEEVDENDKSFIGR
ncbi:sensor histidine kinase [Schinkia azotoformans]|nr:ATP-binding protein [Schinkia azotoformans]MEC1747573.1 hypothetical protein [Schinkia azotoformans]MEC1759337.1 hypothetical protein [Schinkia azotoformans]MED4377111.1 hypothetical protein [Schinkia azotoformans]